MILMVALIMMMTVNDGDVFYDDIDHIVSESVH
jgi:hypothetical protein